MKIKDTEEINGVKVAESATLETFTVNPEKLQKLQADISKLAKASTKAKDACRAFSDASALIKIRTPHFRLIDKDDKPS